MSGGRLRFFPPTSAKKERDEELALFRELFKREREKNTINLLESVSTEFEPVEGNSVVFKISAGKKSDTHGNDNGKNDYDWLKTPPATPLFQSLEMDVGQGNNPSMIIHKELPIIPALKPSRFSENESKTVSKPPSSPSISSFRSATSPRCDSPDPHPYPLSPPRSITTPITTPRFRSQRFAKESDKEPSTKPLQTGRFLRRKEEPRPKSPGSLYVASTTTSSRSETPDVNPKPTSIRRVPNMVCGKEEPKPVGRFSNRFSKEGPTKQKPDPKLQTRQVKSVETKPTLTSPSSISATSATSSRPDSPDSKPIKSKGVPKSSENPIKKIIKGAPGKQNAEAKSNNPTVSPSIRSRFPATLPDFPNEAPPNLVTSMTPGQPTSATRSRPGVPAMASVEQRRSPSATKTRRPEPEEMVNESRGSNNGGVVIGSSMVERMLNARKSTVTGKVASRGEKASKVRGV